MAKRRNRKSGSPSKGRGRRSGRDEFPSGMSVRRISPAEAERFMAAGPAWTVQLGPEAMALATRISHDIDCFEFEVSGLLEPSLAALLIGSEITGQLRERGGAEAGWADLDVDGVIDAMAWLPAEDHDAMHIFLRSLITWLANSGLLEEECVARKLAALDRREPATVAAMRAAFAAELSEDDFEAIPLELPPRVAGGRGMLN